MGANKREGKQAGTQCGSKRRVDIFSVLADRSIIFSVGFHSGFVLFLWYYILAWVFDHNIVDNICRL